MNSPNSSSVRVVGGNGGESMLNSDAVDLLPDGSTSDSERLAGLGAFVVDNLNVAEVPVAEEQGSDSKSRKKGRSGNRLTCSSQRGFHFRESYDRPSDLRK